MPPRTTSSVAPASTSSIVSSNLANLGYWVRASRVRQGVATAAAALLARFGFDELRLARLEIVVRLDNAASRRVAEKLGCRLEGVARNRLLFDGTPFDAAMYAMIPDDLVQATPRPRDCESAP